MTAAENVALLCPYCGYNVSEHLIQERAITCNSCHARLEVTLLPALFRSESVQLGQLVTAQESACFLHEDRVAVYTCSRCGRFLCPFCRIAWATEDLCVVCVETANSGPAAESLVSTRFHFDSFAFALSTLPILTGFFSIITAPAALGFSIFNFRRDCSITPRSKLRFGFAILFSLGTIVGWIWLFVYAFRQREASTTSSIPFF